MESSLRLWVLRVETRSSEMIKQNIVRDNVEKELDVTSLGFCPHELVIVSLVPVRSVSRA